MKNLENKNDYYKNAAHWAYDLYQAQTLWLRRALFGLIVLMICLLLSLMTNLLLFPLKEKVPYLYAFDHATGEITKIGSLDKTSFTTDWALSRYLLIQYVIQRESYHIDNLDLPYQQVYAQSDDKTQKQYEEEVKSSHPYSPYRLYGKDKYVTVRVISINRLNDNTVDIKFEKKLHDNNTGTLNITYKEAIIKWIYSETEITQKMLDRDPLGFKVTYYQVSQVNLDRGE